MRAVVDIRANNKAGIYRYAKSMLPDLLAIGQRQPGVQIGIIHNKDDTNFVAELMARQSCTDSLVLCAPHEPFVRNSTVVRDWIHEHAFDCYFTVNYLFDPSIRIPVGFVLHDVIPLLPQYAMSDTDALGAYGAASLHAARLACSPSRREWGDPTLDHTLAAYCAELIPRLAKRADRIITVSTSSRAMIESILPRAANKVRVIPNGLDVDLFRRRTGPERSGEGPAMILFVGVDKPHKRLGDLIQAFRQVEPNLLRRAALLVVSPRPLAPATMDQIAGAKSHALFSVEIGISDLELAERYHAAAAVCCPSAIEGFGFVGVEAAACGRPVIASDIPAFRETLGSSASYHPVGDIEMLTNLIAAAIQGALRPARPEPYIRSWQATAEDLFSTLVELSSLAHNKRDDLCRWS